MLASQEHQGKKQLTCGFIHETIATTLRPSFLPISCLLSRFYHLKFIHRLFDVEAKRKGKEHPRTIGMGGIGKTQSKISAL